MHRALSKQDTCLPASMLQSPLQKFRGVQWRPPAEWTRCQHLQVSVADFSGYLSRLSTPRELMIMMTELFARIEAKPHEQLKAEDLEISVSSALQQAVA